MNDNELKRIYNEAIKGLSANITDLLVFYPDMPREEERAEKEDIAPLYAGELLALTKMCVRNYGIAITETATPEVRKVLKKQLNSAIELHEKIFNYMYKKGLYPAYNLEKLLQNDIKLARKALS